MQQESTHLKLPGQAYGDFPLSWDKFTPEIKNRPGSNPWISLLLLGGLFIGARGRRESLGHASRRLRGGREQRDRSCQNRGVGKHGFVKLRDETKLSRAHPGQYRKLSLIE